MEIKLKKAEENDRNQCIAVEKVTMDKLHYLADVWDYFQTTKGDLICAYVDGEMAGIGKFTILYDGSAWLETLRVDPKYQGLGVGKEIYKNFFEQAKKYNCQSMAMYTGEKNIVSAGLASRYLFKKSQSFRGYNLRSFSPSEKDHNFSLVNSKRGLELIMNLNDQYHNYLVSNRTFYRINPATARGFVEDNKVYENIENDSFIVCGSRFQHGISLHISMMDGDYSACLDFAKAYATRHNIPKITFTFALENPKLENFLIENSFVQEPSDLITMEIVL